MKDLAIVGAGPAGMAAALAVADAGLSVTVVDEQARAGGQIFRRPPAEFGARHGTYRPYAWAQDLIERFEDHPNIETHFRSTAFGILRDREGPEPDAVILAVSTPEGGRRVAARRLLLATGGYDMAVAFPGWTLPGVMTAGAVQSLLKSQKLLAGRRIVLAGSHPIQLILAAQLLDAGAELVAIALARGLPGPSEMIRALPAIPGHVSIFAEAARALKRILRARVPILRHTLISEVQSRDGALEVDLAKVDKHWNRTGETRRVAADVLALGYGFTPSSELARQAGCAMAWNAAGGGWTVRHDAAFLTSAPGIFVAGEPTGIAGAEQARAEGQIAGLSIAGSLGRQAGSAEMVRARRNLRSAVRFSGVMQRMFEPRRVALAELSRSEETLICRCEEIRNGKVEAILADNPFLSSVSALKLECRSGMGSCQGRYCEGTIAARIAVTRQLPIETCGYFNASLPVKPVSLEAYHDLG